MQINLIFTGKSENNYIKNEISEYQKRIGHYITLEIKEIPNLKNTSGLKKDIIRIKEGELILRGIGPKDFFVLLDEKGKEFSSSDFSKFIEGKQISGQKNLIFVIGGAFGFSEEVYERADLRVSLSKMTFPHQLVRVIFLEQLYRAFTIIKGEKYHHD